MSPAITKTQHSTADLHDKRERLLREAGLKNPSQLAKIASERVLTEEEEALAYELESIAFLLGEKPQRIN
jgi:hypothetical protein